MSILPMLAAGKSFAYYAACVFAVMLLSATVSPEAGFAASLTSSQQADLDLVSDYLNRNKTFKARITQYNPDGTQNQGTLHVKRPGRLRLDYDPPDPLQLLASRKHFTLVDRKTNQATHYPFFTTPAALLLANPIDLNNPDIAIRSIERKNGLIHLHLSADAKQDDAGKMILIFSTQPVSLRGWQVIDVTDNRVNVVFDSLTHNVRYPNANFFLYQAPLPSDHGKNNLGN